MHLIMYILTCYFRKGPDALPRWDRVMEQVLATVPTAGLEAVVVAVELVIECGALSDY